jgi:hypothetical protein
MKTALANLPPLYHFHRPFWAYDYLGWPLLREQLFGKTWLLIERLEVLGEVRISEQDLSALMDEANVSMPVRCQISAVHKDQTARELAEWYRMWEDAVFEAYLAREREDEASRLGKSD